MDSSCMCSGSQETDSIAGGTGWRAARNADPRDRDCSAALPREPDRFCIRTEQLSSERLRQVFGLPGVDRMLDPPTGRTSRDQADPSVLAPFVPGYRCGAVPDWACSDRRHRIPY